MLSIMPFIAILFIYEFLAVFPVLQFSLSILPEHQLTANHGSPRVHQFDTHKTNFITDMEI
jgi:hypothetical protein